MMGLMGAVSRPPEIVGYKRVTVAEIKPVRLLDVHAFCCKFIPLLLLRLTTILNPFSPQLIAAEEALQKSRGKSGRRDDEE